MKNQAIVITRAKLDESTISALMELSSFWAKEGCSFGIVPNNAEDIHVPCFIAKDGDSIIGYAFGKPYICEKKTSYIELGTPCFEIEEIFVLPSYRGQGIGKALFKALENEGRKVATFISLATSTKDYRKILKFYVEDNDMTFHSAFLLKPLYAFMGADTPSLTPLPDFAKAKDQRHLYDLLRRCWGKDTCAPRMQKKWSEDNPTLGQCSITAFLAQDIFGGEVYGVPLPEGGFHCFNKVGDVCFDLTSEQFGIASLSYTLDYPQSRDEHFAKTEKKDRYLLLKERLLALL